jgi:hypothetical protein
MPENAAHTTAIPRSPSAMPPQRPDPLVASSRREAIFAVSVWFAATVYTVGYCAIFGYEPAPSELEFVLGFPAWVFWGIVVPWSASTIVSIWFAARVMRDDPLGEETTTESETGAAIEMTPKQTGEPAHSSEGPR